MSIINDAKLDIRDRSARRVTPARLRNGPREYFSPIDPARPHRIDCCRLLLATIVLILLTTTLAYPQNPVLIQQNLQRATDIAFQQIWPELERGIPTFALVPSGNTVSPTVSYVMEMQGWSDAADAEFLRFSLDQASSVPHIEMIRLHGLMAAAGKVIGYEELSTRHYAVACDLVRRFIGSQDCEAEIRTFLMGYPAGTRASPANLLVLFDRVAEDYQEFVGASPGRVELRIDRSSSLFGLENLVIRALPRDNATPNAELFARSFSFQLANQAVADDCQGYRATPPTGNPAPCRLLRNGHLRYFQDQAADQGIPLPPMLYFQGGAAEQGTATFVANTRTSLSLGNGTRVVPISAHIPDGEYYVYTTNSASATGPNNSEPEANLVIDRARGAVAAAYSMRILEDGSGVDVIAIEAYASPSITPTWKLADLNIGINERTRKMEGSVAGRSFHLLNDSLALQGQAELAFRSHSDVSLSPPALSTESERVSDFYGTDFQFDFGPVVRAGSFQFAAINSFRWVTREDFDEGGLLSQSSFNFDYLSPGIGQVGAFFTLNHGSAPVVRTTEVDATVVTEEFLSVMRQAGMTFRLNLPRDSSLEGTLGYLDSAMERNRPGGVLRHVYPLGGNVSLTSEVGLNESFVAADNSWRFAMGLRIGDWGRGHSRGIGAISTDTPPVPVIVPRLRYERLTRTLRPDNGRPVADAGEDRTVDAGTRVVLDGSGSFDPDGDSLNYEWTQISDGVPVVLGDRNSPHPEFIADEGGVYEFDLVVTDSLGFISDPDTVSISVEPELRPVLREFRVDPRDIEEDETARLRWDVEGVPSVRIQHVHMETGQEGIFDALQSNDARDVMPAVGVTRYSLFALDESGAVVGPEPLAQAEIRVNPKPQTQITLFDADPEIVRSGESTTLTWTVVGATGSCRFGTETGGALEELGIPLIVNTSSGIMNTDSGHREHSPERSDGLASQFIPSESRFSLF